MKKETYIQELEKLAKKQTMLVNYKAKIRTEFIEANKPCNIDDNVTVITQGDRKITGQAKGFSIDSEKNVYVDSIKPEKGVTVYLSVAHKSIQTL